MSSRISLERGAEPFPGYRLKELRGRGGFAEVWSASTNQGELALKFFASRQTTSTVKEVKTFTELKKLDHPSLLRMHHVWSVPGYIVIAMDLAEGSLLDLLDAYQSEYHMPLPPDTLCFYLLQVADGLDFLNARQHQFEGRKVGWQHCDIKPSNILLFNECVRIADFGLSTPTYGFLTPYKRGGTLDFAAPEFHREMLSDRSDQYSLAVTYYFLRTGVFPFPEVEQGFTRRYSYTRPEPDLSGVPRPERKILYKALDVQPQRRWDSCRQMMDELVVAINKPDSGSHSTIIHVDAEFPENAVH